MTDFSPEAKELLQQARTAFSPSEDRLLAVRSALKAQLGASMNAPSSASSSASTAGGLGARVLGAAGWSTGHSVLAVVAIGAIGVGAVAMWPLASRSSGTAAVPSELVSEPQSGVVVAPAPEQETPSAPTTPNPSPVPHEQAPPDRSLEHGTPPALRGATRARARSDAPREALALPPAAVAPTAGATDSLAEEVRMLREARAALDRDDAAQALRLLDTHEKRFRRGTLHEERLATRVQALCVLGLVDRARLAAQELERVAPRSPHLARVRASCIAGPANR